MSWQSASFVILAIVLLGGFAWYERSRPPSQVVALVAALAALAIAGRVAFAAIPNVKPTTDIVIFAGYALGPAPGFAVGALSGLVSNFWFGQGPWTPWQMAGWGLCGVFGAALALGGHRLGRFSLAAACAFAGIAYGALLNLSLMATYGGDLSLERFLVLESRAVPFDAAHAIGNAVLALIAGPTIVRMLIRFRTRFEWRTPALAVSILIALTLVPSVVPSSAEAAGAGSAERWLLSTQNGDGGFGPSTEDESSTMTTAWAMLGLEAVGRNPLDVRSPAGSTPVDFLRANVGELGSSGDLARTIVALEGAGVDPHSFGGRNLVSALAARRRDNGSFENWPGTTAFSAIALRTAGGGGLERTISWLASVQNDDGGWGDTPGAQSNPDVTSLAMQAMPSSEAAQRGLAYLRKAQRPNGGFALGGFAGVNSQSTAWAVQGVIGVGGSPTSIQREGNSALDYLAARQQSDGRYDYSSSSDQTPTWVTAQVMVAVAEKSFPIAVSPRQPKPKPSPATITPVPTAPSPEVTPVPVPGSLPLPESLPGSGGSASGKGGRPAPPPSPVPSAGTGGTPATPPTSPVEEEPPAATPPASESTADPALSDSAEEATSPLAPLGIGLLTGGLALGGAVMLGRRNGW